MPTPLTLYLQYVTDETAAMENLQGLYEQTIKVITGWASGLAVMVISLIAYIWYRKDRREDKDAETLASINERLGTIAAQTQRIPALEEEVKRHTEQINNLNIFKENISGKVHYLENEKKGKNT